MQVRCIAERRRKKEEGRGKREEGYPRKKKPKFPVDIHPWVYTNDTNGHNIISCPDNSGLEENYPVYTE